ncbi:MAG: PQQ-binding-like beta-propeller repeat protein [Halorubrum sp.]|uniref:outer membrane protein assembly factor BamB family protein n=1 Tax=Halorubrum sp. TaxID=1879286 RepID=UPI0039705C0E
MTGRDATVGLSRRRFLAAVGLGVVGALAGCGYRPGGGDLAWESSLAGGGLLEVDDRWFLPAGDRLFVLRNRSGRTYDFESETWYDVENAAVTALDPAGDTRLEAETERRAAGPPAVTETSIVAPVEGDRVTAIDRETAALDLDDPTVDEDGSEADERDPIRWQVDVDAASADGSTASADGSTDDDLPENVDAVRASDRLVAAVVGDDVVVLDAETGDRAFALSEAWPDGSDVGSLAVTPDRVAVDGGDAWVAVAGVGPDGGSGGDGTVLARFDPTGERRVARSLSVEVDWLAVFGGTLVARDSNERVTGYRRDLDRRFALSVSIPSSRPRAISRAGGRFYYSAGGTMRAIDAAAGEVVWERSDLPTRDLLAADADGVYVAEDEVGLGEEDEPRITAVGTDGENRWTAPLPDGVTVDELFAVGDRLIVVDDAELYGFRAAPGERWSLLG